jgi:Lon protease-like protein
MVDLPLFPLNTVLFPGMPMPLHIFESRYKQMIKYCLTENTAFGVSLIHRGSEAFGPLAEPHNIGCTARIIEVQALDDGRMNITTVGERRFRIHSLNYDMPYLVGKIEIYPFPAEDLETLTPATLRLVPKVQQYIKLLNEIDEVELNPNNLPKDPLLFAQTAAALLQMPPNEKQELLKTTSVLNLLDATYHIYNREIPFLRAIIEHGEDEHRKYIEQN